MENRISLHLKLFFCQYKLWKSQSNPRCFFNFPMNFSLISSWIGHIYFLCSAVLNDMKIKTESVLKIENKYFFMSSNLPLVLKGGKKRLVLLMLVT